MLILKGDLTDEIAIKVKELAYDAVRGKDIRVSIDTNPVNMV